MEERRPAGVSPIITAETEGHGRIKPANQRQEKLLTPNFVMRPSDELWRRLFSLSQEEGRQCPLPLPPRHTHFLF